MKLARFEVVFLTISLLAGIAAIISPTDHTGIARAKSNNDYPYPYPNPTIVVTNTNDSGTGSLRQAIINSSDEDSITFDPSLAGQTIHLGSKLLIAKSITIDGSDLTPPITLSGDTNADENGDISIMEIGSGSTVKITYVDFINGKNEDYLLAGGINNLGGFLELKNCSFSGNTGDTGGAILNEGTITISDCTFTNNTAIEGGAIFNYLSGTATITDSIFRQNIGEWDSGALANIGVITITGSEFSQNSAVLHGGGAIVSSMNGSATIANSTITGNSAPEQGGGVAIADANATTTLVNVTIAENTGGGLYILNGTAHITNSIIANNNGNPDCYLVDGSVNTNVKNIILVNGTGPNSCGTPFLSTDPLLDPLSLNGGITQTMALLSGSLAIDAGDDTTCAADPVNNLDQRGVARPQGTSCDIGSFEFAPTFTDVSMNHWAWQYIERLYSAGITGGCGSGNYCPDNQVTRSQMAVFLLRGIHGSAYTPPAATGTMFTDVPASLSTAAWIEQLANEGITSGCGGGNYCPNNSVTRAQMAIFLLRAEHGSAYTPPAATGTMFGDVPASLSTAAWIEQLANEGITSGCGGGNYCPNNPVTRASMAVFLVRTFNLP